MGIQATMATVAKASVTKNKPTKKGQILAEGFICYSQSWLIHRKDLPPGGQQKCKRTLPSIPPLASFLFIWPSFTFLITLDPFFILH